MALLNLAAETRGIRKHFWEERTYKDHHGVERWQTERQIREKLWALTRFDQSLFTKINLFPDIEWEPGNLDF